eukprot:g28283.t1
MPNFLSRLRKKRRCCASLTITPTREVHISVGYCHSNKLDTFHPLNLSSVDVDGGVFSSFLSEVNDEFFSFADIERESRKANLSIELFLVADREE